MKIYKYICLILMSTLMWSCFSDDTNRDYTTLDKPQIVNPDKDPALFVDAYVYSAQMYEPVIITPNIQYKDMNDLAYEWMINGEVVSREKDLNWPCEINTSNGRVSGIFAIYRLSAGNADIYTFTVSLEKPYATGFAIMAEEGGQMHIHFASETTGEPYQYTFYENAGSGEAGFAFTENTKLTEYWSCINNRTGDLMYIDREPDNCFTINGESMAQEFTLRQQFVNDQFPANLKVKDIMFGGFVSYVLDETGKIYLRKADATNQTGRYLDFPVQFQGVTDDEPVELQISHMIPIPKLSQSYCLLYDKSKGSGRFLLVDTQYTTFESDQDEAQQKAGQIYEFPPSANLDGITDKELIDARFVRELYGYPASHKIEAIFKGNDGKYYIREFSVSFDSYYGSIESTDMLDPVYQELTDFGDNSIFAVTTIEAAMMFTSDYMYYTSQNDAKKVYVKKRDSNSVAKEFHTFDSEVVAIESGKIGRRGSYMAFGLKDGTFFIYCFYSYNVAGNKTDYENYDPERIIFEQHIEGEIKQIGRKFGTNSKFS